MTLVVRTIVGLLSGFMACTMIVLIAHYADMRRHSRFSWIPLKSIVMRDLSFILASVYVSLDQFSKVRNNVFTWRFPIAVVSVLIGVPALTSLLSSIRKTHSEIL